MSSRSPLRIPCALAAIAISAVIFFGCTLGEGGAGGGESTSTSATGGATSTGGSSSSSAGTTHTGGTGGVATTGGAGATETTGGTGATETTGGTGATETTGGTGGASSECVTASDCPAPEDPCRTVKCVSGACAEGFAAAGSPLPTQIPGDCLFRVCDGAGTAIDMSYDADVLDDGSDCTLDTCQSGTPTNTPLPAGAPCDQAAGKLCDGAGACVACLQTSDCTSPDVCSPAHACLAPTCVDGTKDGTETDVDCGGSCVATCGTGMACVAASDCESGVCTEQKCVAPACDDGVKNGGESDVDCGGLCPAKCGPGTGCTVNADCLGGSCSGSVCLPSCMDGVKNGSETDVDCGGPQCDPCATGGPCATAADCVTTHCVDGVCCDSDCSGTCVACTTSLKGAGPNGVCAPILAGLDPQNECAVGDPSLCGSSPDGSCSGAGACTNWPVGTVCGPATCVGSGVGSPPTCDGLSACQPGPVTPCSPYACSNAACLASCVGNWQCASGATCVNNVCVLKKAAGQPCNVWLECLSQHCVDGVCCSTLCDGLCESCVLPGSVGTCSNLPANAPDPPLCPAPNTCGANGDCPGYLPVGAPCGSGVGVPGDKPPECMGLYCADHHCCKSECTTPCYSCFTGTCYPVSSFEIDSWPVHSFNGCGQANACYNSCDVCGPDATCISP